MLEWKIRILKETKIVDRNAWCAKEEEYIFLRIILGNPK